MKKYRIVAGADQNVEQRLNDLADSYTPQQFDTGRVGGRHVTVLLRARSEEPDPADDWCIGTDSKGKRCLNDAVRDGYCKRHWREEEQNGKTRPTIRQ